MAIPPELTRAIRKLSKLLVAKIGLNAIDRIGEQAINTILESWYDEQGYEYSGEPVNWHHEGRKAENNILFDTGLLHSAIGYEVIDADAFKITVDSFDYPDRGNSPRDTKFISSLWQGDFPHLGIPKEYQLERNGHKAIEIEDEEISDAFEDSEVEQAIRELLEHKPFLDILRNL